MMTMTRTIEEVLLRCWRLVGIYGKVDAQLWEVTCINFEVEVSINLRWMWW